MDDSFNIAELIAKKIKGEITENELSVLNEWIASSSENRKLYENSVDAKIQINKLKEYNTFNKEGVWKKIDKKTPSTRKIRINKRFVQYAAAILLPLFIIGGIAYNYLSPQQTPLASIDENIKPGSQKAVLFLSNGGAVELNENNTNADFKEKGVEIDNKNNQLKYTANETGVKEQLVYNELKTPRGGGYNLKLADGTEVWLNAGSSLKFPVAFTDSTREVYMAGEAFFKVAHNGKPFIVKSQGSNIRVMGTSFNVSAYSDESLVTTTLVEGKVQIELQDDMSSNLRNTVLTPGLQAVFDKSKDDIVVDKVVASQYTSWIEGKLEFTNQDLELVMKKLSRWYDFEYTFKNEKAKGYHFSARINNNESISSILAMLEMTTNVKFEIDNNTIVIL